MDVKRLQSEDFHSYIDNYQKNQDRIELLHKEIADWEHKFSGMKAVQFDRVPATPSYSRDGLQPIQREAMFRIEQCYKDIEECERKMQTVDDLLQYLMSDETVHKVISMRIQRKSWDTISYKVSYSHTNCRYLYWRAIERYMKYVRTFES